MSTNLQIGIVGLPNVGKSTLLMRLQKQVRRRPIFLFVLLNLMWVLWKCRIIEFMIWQVYLIRKNDACIYPFCRYCRAGGRSIEGGGVGKPVFEPHS